MKNLLKVIMILLISSSGQTYAQKVGEQAPDFEVAILEADTFRLSEQAGKVVMIFFFGNGCPSCVANGGNVESNIYQQFKDNENFVAVGIDTWNVTSNENSVTQFKSSAGITFPLGLSGGDIAATYETTYDRLLVVNHQGVLFHKGILVAGNDITNTVSAINESLEVTRAEIFEEQRRIQVYPNPVSDLLHVDTGGEVATKLELFDMTGRRVLETPISMQKESEGMIEVSLQHLKEGVYIYSIHADEGLMTGKVLVKR